jgi:hypothetical protein
LPGLPPEQHITRLATYWGAADSAYPFRQGNTRTEKSVLEQIGNWADQARSRRRADLVPALSVWAPEAECDGYAQRGEGSFAVSEDETISDVIAEFERASRRSRSIAEPYDLEHTVQHPRAGTVSLRGIYLLGIEDFARQTAHADILVEQINDPITP